MPKEEHDSTKSWNWSTYSDGNWVEPHQYVQDLVREDDKKIYKTWMEEDGVIFLCGKVAMAEEVGQVLRNILEVYGKMDKEEATQVMKNMKSQGSYRLDLFG